jgi:hypothetical protein
LDVFVDGHGRFTASRAAVPLMRFAQSLA